MSGRDKTRGDAVVAGIRAAGGTADFVAADLNDEHSVRELAARAVEAGGGHVDILVNSGGIFPFGATADTPADQIDEVFAVNVKAPYLLVAALAPAMAERGHGAIVNVTTMVAEFGMNGMGLYGSSKAALDAADQILGRRVRPRRRPRQRREPRPHPHRRHPTDGRRAGPARTRAARPGASGSPKRSPRRSPSSPPTRPVSFTASCCPSMAAASPSDNSPLLDRRGNLK